MDEQTKEHLLALFGQMQLNFEPIHDVKISTMTIEDRPGMITFRLRTRAQVTHLILVPEDFVLGQARKTS